MKNSICFALAAFGLLGSLAHASLVSTSGKNLWLLQTLPLFEGFEKKVSSEDAQTQTLVEIFTKIQDEAKKPAPALLRGTHAKGSCYDGTLQIFSAGELKANFHYPDHLIARLQQGLFDQPGALKALMRFANAKGDHNPDTVGDVRGLSFSLDTTGRTTALNGDAAQDFMMNSTPMFAVRNISEFTELMKTARTFQGDFYFVNPLYVPAVLRAKNLLDRFERADTVSYATESYWGNLPYSHGLKADGTPAEIVKYKLTPCDGRDDVHESSAGKKDDYLQTDIDRRAAAGQVCFDLQVQLFDKDEMAAAGLHPNRSMVDWIENGGELWDDAILPFRTIARLTIAGENDPAVTKSSHRVSCNGVGFNTRLHSTRATQPLGSIARVRAYVEENSRARRMGQK